MNPRNLTRLYIYIQVGASETMLPAKKRNWQDILDLLKADVADIAIMQDGVHFMAGDDLSYEKNLPVNMLATRYFRRVYPSSTHMIRGPVVILPEESII